MKVSKAVSCNVVATVGFCLVYGTSLILSYVTCRCGTLPRFGSSDSLSAIAAGRQGEERGGYMEKKGFYFAA